MNVLSLFDGMSCGRIALERLGIEVDNYYASEIDKYAIQIAQKNYPDTKQIGDVLNWQSWDIDWSSIDLVSGGFPCQSWSLAGKQLGDKDERGMMLWVMLDIMKKVIKHNPNVYYLMENVRMKKEFEEYITYHTKQALPDVNKYLINSALVSAQNRVRYYWTNIPNVKLPEDKGIVLKDILEDDAEEPMYSNIYGGFGEKKPREHFKKSVTIRANSGGGAIPNIKLKDFEKNLEKMTTKEGKSFALTASYNGAVAWNSIKRKQRSMVPVVKNDAQKINWRKLTPIECERLQTVPDNYTEGVSNTQRYKMLGNSFTVDVIAHIFANMELDNKIADKYQAITSDNLDYFEERDDVR